MAAVIDVPHLTIRVIVKTQKDLAVDTMQPAGVEPAYTVGWPGPSPGDDSVCL
jgi:hypothetical protein